MNDIHSFKISSKNRQITLTKKTGNESCTFYFPWANADTFAQHLKSHCKTVKHRYDKNTILIVEPNAEMQVINKSFNELDLFQDHSAYVAWNSVGNIVSNLKQRPYETALEAFAKLSDIGIHRYR